MKVLNIGSINIDHVYGVEHFARPGETLGSRSYAVFAGGKGYNQSIALARAGATTVHAGKVGPDAKWLVERLGQEGVDTGLVRFAEMPTGHAIIQVVPSGENAIVLHGGANQCISEADVVSSLSACDPRDVLLLQNETSSVSHALEHAHKKKMHIVFNPAPMSAAVRDYRLDLVDTFILNEVEAGELTGSNDPGQVQARLRQLYPRATIVLTLGARGAVFMDSSRTIHQPGLAVEAIDTTAAGDTFTGFFLAEMMRTGDPPRALQAGCQAAAICVTRPGASDSIPRRADIASLSVTGP